MEGLVSLYLEKQSPHTYLNLYKRMFVAALMVAWFNFLIPYMKKWFKLRSYEMK